MPFRKFLIELPCGFCNDPVNGPFPKTWYKDVVTQELKDELLLPGAIKKKDSNVVSDIIYDDNESLYMLAWCIYYANRRFNHPEEIDKMIITDNDDFEEGPATLIQFMNCHEIKIAMPLDIIKKMNSKNEQIAKKIVNENSGNDIMELSNSNQKSINTSEYVNPFTYRSQETTPIKDLVTLTQYYDEYKRYCYRQGDNVVPVKRATVKEYLTRMGLMQGQDRVKFLFNNKIQVLPISDIIYEYYCELDYAEPVCHGILKSVIHTYVQKRGMELSKIHGNFHIPSPAEILAYIQKFYPHFIKNSGISGGSYYHLQPKTNLLGIQPVKPIINNKINEGYKNFIDFYGPNGVFKNPILYNVTFTEFVQANNEIDPNHEFDCCDSLSRELIRDNLLVKCGKEPIGI